MFRRIVPLSIWLSVIIGATLLVLTTTRGVKANPEAAFPAIEFQETVTDLDYPVHLTHAGDGSGRLYIVEQPGRILIDDNGLVGIPFLDIRDRVRSPRTAGGDEEGLLSVAFPPGFGSIKDHFYVYYTNNAGDNQVSRFSMSSIPEQADPASEELILYLDHPGEGPRLDLFLPEPVPVRRDLHLRRRPDRQRLCQLVQHPGDDDGLTA